MLSRTSRILLAATFALVGAYLLLERPREKRDEVASAGRDQLASFAMADIDSVALERPSDSLRFVKVDGRWRLIHPVRDLAEPGAIGTMLDALRTAHINRNLGPENDLAPYGLDHPDARITLAAAHRVVLELAVGKHTVDNAWCYARSTSHDVLLLPVDVHRSSTLPLEAYRDHRVLDFQVQDVSAYRIRNQDRPMAWVQRGHGWFAAVRNDSVAGDSVLVTAPLHRLRGLRVGSFLAPTDTTAIVADSVRVMSLRVADQTYTIRFAHTGRVWTARVGDRNATVTDDVTDLFSHTTTELRDRRLLQFDPAAAVRILFAAPDHTGELVRTGGRWSFPNPATGRIDPRRAADFVRALQRLKWSQTGTDAARAGVQYRIEIRGAHDRMIDELTGGPLNASTCWVSSLSSHGTWLIGSAALDELSDRFARLKER